MDDEIIKQRAEQAYNLLNTWSKTPGTDKENKINFDYLNNWISEARKLSEECGRLTPADLQIGKVFSLFPSTDDDQWPPEAICDIIDSINSKALNEGFETGIFNKRGTISKPVFEGGKQECELSDHYKQLAKKLSNKYQITAS